MSSASSSSSSRGGKSHSPNSGLMDAQKLLASIALSRPAPFGEIPRRLSQQSQPQQRIIRHEGEDDTHLSHKRPSSAHGNGHGSTQILSFATRRPSEPQTSTSISPPPTAISSSGMHLHVPMDVKLSVSDAFEYDDEWLEGGKRIYAGSSSRDGIDSLPLSPTSPSEEWDERLSTTSTSQPRSRQATSSRSRESTSPSTPTSSRSSSLRRKPSLLNQTISPPISSSQCIAVSGRQIITPTQSVISSSAKGKQSQSLAERGHSVEATMKANMPELYNIARGRSNRVSPSRRWDRRGASASVLSAAGKDDENSESTLTSSKAVRKESAGSLEHALFDSDDDGELFQTSEEDDDDEYDEAAEHGEETVLQSSRRSSVDRDRRRELRILLAAPSTSQESNNDVSEKMISHSLSTAASGMSEGNGSNDDRLSIGNGSQYNQDLQSSNDSVELNNADVADDESDGTTATSAASLLSRRSKHGRKTLRSTLKSISPPSRPSLDVIVAGMTPSEELNPLDVRSTNEEQKEDDFIPSSYVSRSSAMSSDRNSSSVRAISTSSVPVDADSDPLLGQSFGSVADNMQIDAVEWNDNSASGPSTPKLNDSETVTNSRQSSDVRKTVAEHEDERRMGFAAAYQQRLAALSMRLWSNGKSGRSREKSIETTESSSSKSPERGEEEKTSISSTEPHPSLFTSSWRHLAMLPNLLLAPALGTASTSHTPEGPAPTSTTVSKEAEAYSSIAQVIETASAHIPQESTDSSNDREAALQAAQKAVAHLASIDAKARPPMLASRTIVAIDRALEEMQHQNEIPTTPTTPTNNKQDRKRSGRGVMTPLEADADVSAYVSGLGLPIDPDVELSSVVHLQTFRSDTRAKRATSVSRESTVGMPIGSVEKDKREHKRTFSDSQKQRLPLMQSKIVTPSVPAIVEGSSQQKSIAEAQFEKMLSNKRGTREPLRDFSSRRAATVRAPKCSRPAVQAPVPGNYSAYNSSASDEDMQSDTEAAKNDKHDKHDRSSQRDNSAKDQDNSRGRGRSSAKRSTSPISNQQCAIGLFSSGSSNVSRSRSGRQGRKFDDRSSTTQQIAPSVLRVRSSPNLSAMKSEEEFKTAALQAEKEGEEEEQRCHRKTKREREEGRESDRVGGRRRGRGDGVKRVSASFADGNTNRSSATLIRSNSMSDLPLLNAKLIASSVHASSLASNGGAMISKSNASSASPSDSNSSSSSSAEAAVRLPIVGAGNIPHLAGRPSMVSNGAHLLMLSLELEMMRNRKITGSLKPRWLKARMRTELFGPAAIVAMMAAERQNAAVALPVSENGTEMEEDENSTGHKHSHHSRLHHTHEHKAHIGLHTVHHSAIHHQNHSQQHNHNHHGMHATDRSLGYNKPKNRSSLRFELE